MTRRTATAHMPYAPEPDVVVIDIAPAGVDLLSARSIMEHAVSTQAELVALRSQAPADCSPADIGTALDRRFLDALIVQSGKSLDALRMRNGDLEKEIERLRDENRALATGIRARGNGFEWSVGK